MAQRSKKRPRAEEAAKKARQPIVRWTDTLYVEIYDLVKQGLTKKAIAEVIGISVQTLNKWITERPALKAAIKKARKSDESLAQSDNFIEYIYKHLPPEVQEVWDELEQFDNEENSIRRTELLLRQPTKIRQHLFVHALVVGRFNPSEACRRVGVSKSVYEGWITTDPNFSRLVDEIQWHKKNFFESALIGLVAQGDTGAVVFANKTINRDRGYDQKQEININARILHGTVDVEALNLPIEVQRQLLVAAREQLHPKQIELIEHPVPVTNEDDD